MVRFLTLDLFGYLDLRFRLSEKIWKQQAGLVVRKFSWQYCLSKNEVSASCSSKDSQTDIKFSRPVYQKFENKTVSPRKNILMLSKVKP